MTEGFVVRGTLLHVLRSSRVLGGAPLRFDSVAGGVVASVSPLWAVYGWIITTITNTLGCILKYPLVTEDMTHLQLIVSVCILDTFLLTLRVIIGSYTGLKRMKNLSQQLNSINRVLRDYKKKSYSKEKRSVLLNIITMFIVLALVGVIFILRIPTKTYLEAIIYTVTSIIMYYQSIMAVLLEVQVTLVAVKLSEALNILKLQLKEMLNNAGFKSTLKYQQLTRRVGRSYISICDVVTQINTKDSAVIILMFSSTVIFLIFGGYIITSDIIYKPKTSRHLLDLLILAILCSTCIHRIIFFIRACHQIDNEVDEIKELVCELMYHQTRVGDEVPVGLDAISDQLNLTYPAYSPHGMFIVKQSIPMTILSIWVTYAIILVQVRFRKHSNTNITQIGFS